MTASSCIICFNPVPVNHWLESDVKERRNLCRRFCIIMCRYLKINVGEGLITPEKTMSISNHRDNNYSDCDPDNDSSGENWVCCDLCLTSVKSICRIYSNWTNLQLRFNRSIKLIAKVMEAGNCIANLNPKINLSTSESIVNFQKRFLTRVSDNYKSSVDYPHLTLERVKWQPRLKHIKIEPVKRETFLNIVNVDEIFVNETKCDLAPDSPEWRPDSPEDFIEQKTLSLKLPKKRGKKKKIKTELKVTETKKKIHPEFSRTGEKYTCPECPKTFVAIRSIRYHFRMVHENLTEKEKRPFSCIVCGEDMRFANRKNLALHEENIHKDELSFQCGVCEMNFGNRKECRNHQNEIHGIILCGPIDVILLDTKERGDGQPEFICEICRKVCKSRKALGRHKYAHGLGKKNFQCSICGKGFATFDSRNVHERSHGDDRPYECGYCHERFKIPSSCSHHQLKMHKDEKPIIISHLRDKDSEKKRVTLKCEKCPMQFVKRSSLENHMMHKCGVKRFHCKVCGQGFTRNYDRRNHQTKAHIDRKKGSQKGQTGSQNKERERGR